MAYGGTITISFDGGGAAKSDAIVKTSTGRVSWEEDIATGITDGQINCPTVDVSELELLYIKSTQDVLLETNAANAAGGNTLTLKADEPYVWWSGCPYTNMIALDIVTNVFITNASGATATITFEAILDTTP